MLWTRDRPPELFPNSVLTRAGWADPVTGELLITLRSPHVGPGKNLRQTQTGTARIYVAEQQQTIQGTAHIAAPSHIGRTDPTRRVTMIGCARIVCPRPFYTGINPNW